MRYRPGRVTEAPPAALSPGARLFLGVLLAVGMWTATSRYMDPVGDRYVMSIPPGGADFRIPFNCARALLRGIDPYHNDVPELADPWDRTRFEEGAAQPKDGPRFNSFYPPSHFVLDVPFVVASGGDPRLGARLFFLVSLAAAGGLAAVVVALARRLGAVPGGDVAWLLGGALALALAASPGVMLGLERGQSELLLALCAWGGALLLLQGRAGPGVFLLSVAVLCKGYAGLAGGGLLALALLAPGTRRGAALGVGAAALVLLLPVAHLLAEGLRAMSARAGLFIPAPFNHGFKNVAWSVDPTLADAGRVALMIGALGAAALCLAGMWRARAAEEPTRAAWLVLFVTAGLGAMLGWSALSCSYNLVYVLPGALVAGLGSERLAAVTGAPRRPLAALTTIAAACLWLPRMYGPNVPVAGLGLVLLLGLAGWCGAAALRR